MKLLSKLTLQSRLTLVTGLILALCSISLTIFSILNAQDTLLAVVMPTVNMDEILVQTEDNAQNTHQAFPASSGTTGGTFAQTEGSAGYSRAAIAIAKQSFDSKSILFCLVLTIIGTGTVYIATGKALKPVRDLSKKVSAVDVHNLADRVPETAAKDEVSELAKGFNRMLCRLDEAFERQKRFTSSAAHELKTPLATIKAGIQVLHMDSSVHLEDYETNARMTEISVDRLARVVNDLLLLASTGEGADEQIEEILLEPMLEAIQCEIAPLYEEQHIACDIRCETAVVHGNPALLYRAIFNLLENAYKYNVKDGLISVTVYDDDGYVKMTIQDSGSGIAAEHFSLIFEPFYRVDASRSRKIGGSGLGLSIVKTIIERHGGTIIVESHPEKGACFIVTLPK